MFFSGVLIMENFYDRTERLLGAEAIKKLSECHIVILGVGGVGSWCCEALARMGIGEFSLVDFDEIDVTNINRQIHALQSTVGERKVDTMKKRMLDINPSVIVHTYKERIAGDQLPPCLPDGDYTIDCIDDVQAKVALMLWHLEHDKKIISSMGTGNKLGTKPFLVSDISKTKVCPLARAIRQKLRKEGVYKGVEVLYSEEEPHNKNVGTEKPGTICFTPAIAGLTLAKYVVDKCLGV